MMSVTVKKHKCYIDFIIIIRINYYLLINDRLGN